MRATDVSGEIKQPAIGQFGQTFRRYGGTGGVADQPLQSLTVASLNTNVRMHAEAGDHLAAGAFWRVQTIPVDLKNVQPSLFAVRADLRTLSIRLSQQCPGKRPEAH